MELWPYPYLFYYLALFLFWMPAMHRQILFWLYLWQLKEYHWGRFWAHFETQKGKSVFVNPLFFAKIAVLIFGAIYYFWAQKIGIFILLAAGLFFLQGARGVWGILRRNLIHPKLTQKSVLLIAAAHLAVFGLGFLVFSVFLGEMSLLDLAFGAFCLLAIDILLPLIIGLVVLGLQPLTIWRKNKILNQARQIIKNRSDLLVIGITGSYGKSGVKELLAHILSQKYKVLKTQANQNTEMGVALAIINDLKPEHQIFVGEIGAVHKGKIAQTADIAKPKIGILTGINQQHLGVFGGQKNIIDAKFELLEAIPENGRAIFGQNSAAILNFNSKFVRDNFDSQKQKIKSEKIIFVGKDIFASNIKTTTDGLSFDLNYRDQKIDVNTNAQGLWMVDTIILSIAGAIAAGMDFAAAVAIINQTNFTPFNLKIKSGEVKPRQKINIIDSTYSANPDGVMAHLDYLKLWKGKKTIIMPCLIELGSESKKIHFEIGKKIAAVCDLAIITAKDRFGEIKNGALSAGMKSENIIFCDRPQKIADILKNRLSSGDILLLEGRLPQKIIDILK